MIYDGDFYKQLSRYKQKPLDIRLFATVVSLIFNITCICLKKQQMKARFFLNGEHINIGFAFLDFYFTHTKTFIFYLFNTKYNVENIELKEDTWIMVPRFCIMCICFKKQKGKVFFFIFCTLCLKHNI